MSQGHTRKEVGLQLEEVSRHSTFRVPMPDDLIDIVTGVLISQRKYMSSVGVDGVTFPQHFLFSGGAFELFCTPFYADDSKDKAVRLIRWACGNPMVDYRITIMESHIIKAEVHKTEEILKHDGPLSGHPDAKHELIIIVESRDHQWFGHGPIRGWNGMKDLGEITWSDSGGTGDWARLMNG